MDTNLILAWIEAAIGFFAGLSLAFIPTGFCTAAGLVAVLCELIGGFTSFFRLYVFKTVTLIALLILRSLLLGLALVIIIREIVLSFTGLAVFALLRVLVQLALVMLSVDSLASPHGWHIMKPSATIYRDICPCQTPFFYTWIYAVSWLAICCLVIAEGSCAAGRPLLMAVTAPCIILAHISLYYDLFYGRLEHKKYLWKAYDLIFVTSKPREQQQPEDIRLLVDRPYRKSPALFVFFAIFSFFLAIAQFAVTIVFPGANVCLTAHPLECTYPDPRITFAMVFIASVNFVEFLRLMISGRFYMLSAQHK